MAAQQGDDPVLAEQVPRAERHEMEPRFSKGGFQPWKPGRIAVGEGGAMLPVGLIEVVRIRPPPLQARKDLRHPAMSIGAPDPRHEVSEALPPPKRLPQPGRRVGAVGV